MSVPRATVRLQFHRDFTLDDARAVVDYYADLGISHLYASPLTAARPGSPHGYDVIDYETINPELGGMDALRRLASALRGRNMGIVLDIVPNHMAASPHNRWWNDVLLHGRASAYADHFDIDWDVPDAELRGRVLAPVLGEPLDIALGSMRLDRDAAAAFIETGGGRFPVAPGTLGELTPADCDGSSRSGRDNLRALLSRQHYLLAYWREAATRINWRRFFEIGDLVATRMDRVHVFEAAHRLVFRLFGDGLIDGVRVDHVDGIADPRAYCGRLRRGLEQARHDGDTRVPYIVVEKILATGERLRADWHVAGTTGYDFMDQCAALLHDARGAPALDALWSELDGTDFADCAREARREVAASAFPADIDRVLRCWHRESGGGRAEAADVETRRRALHALLEHFVRYRTYLEPGRADGEQRAVLDEAIARATAEADGAVSAALSQLRTALIAGDANAPLLRRFQQLTSPVAAKAVEDTAFYRYGRLISRNEVGSNPARLAASPDEFHADCADRAAALPAALLATATHDHKRGEDVRARLAVVSELASEWREAVHRLRAASADLGSGADVPLPADEYMLYQTIVGAWPPDLAADDEPAVKDFVERIAAWQQKALREAKRRTRWTDPDPRYERACTGFLRALFDRSRPALGELERFARRIAPAGAVNGLVQALLRSTAPGVPDLYQGCDYWDLSLVDPDNRRAVDHAARRESLRDDDVLARSAHWRDGRVKQALLARVLRHRAREPALFAQGSYAPLAIEGPLAAHAIAFRRERDGAHAIVLAARHVAALVDDRLRIDADAWDGTCVRAPDGGRLVDVVSGRTFDVAAAIPLEEAFAALPLALLVAA
ncbi:MAG TPA: malto-oligosyltrehalose synthase [Rhodanobacteraceae bacterium]|nr:malto-oligosyltrehalose synthase [Rhodanobacteraceae bacterium]